MVCERSIPECLKVVDPLKIHGWFHMVRFTCSGCGQPLEHSAPGEQVKCPRCGQRLDVPDPAAVPSVTLAADPAGKIKTADEKFCQECGERIRARAEICPKCGVRQPDADVDPSNEDAIRQFAGNKIAAGICAILLGSFGIHKFILGLTTPGIIMLLVTVLTCGVGAMVMGVIGIVEGIIYLTKSDKDFYRLYAVEKKQWF